MGVNPFFGLSAIIGMAISSYTQCQNQAQNAQRLQNQAAGLANQVGAAAYLDVLRAQAQAELEFSKKQAEEWRKKQWPFNRAEAPKIWRRRMLRLKEKDLEKRKAKVFNVAYHIAWVWAAMAAVAVTIGLGNLLLKLFLG